MDETINTKRNRVFLLCILPSWALNIWPMVAAAFQAGHLDSELGANVILLTVSVASMSIIPLAIVKAWRHHNAVGLLIAPFVLLFGAALFSVNWHNAINVASHVQDKLSADAENAQKLKTLLDDNIKKWGGEAAKIPSNHIRENEDTLKAAEDAAKAATAKREAECQYLGSRCRQAEDAEQTALTHRTNVATAFRQTKDEERLNKQIQSAKEQLSTLTVPKSADPAAAKFASIIGVDGVDEAWVRDNWPSWLTFVAEMIAMFGPSIWMLMLSKPAAARREAEPLPSVVLAGVPHVEPQVATMEPDAAPMPQVASEAPAVTVEPGRRPGIVSEVPSWDDLPDAPPPSGKRTKTGGKAVDPRGDNVIKFPKKPKPEEVLALLSKGRTQKEVAAVLGIGERTVRRIKASSKSGHLASDLAAS